MNFFERFTGHLKTVTKHRHQVFLHCIKAGIVMQGLTHDLSKFSPVEFFTNVKYTEPGKSPVTIQLERIGRIEGKRRNSRRYRYFSG